MLLISTQAVASLLGIQNSTAIEPHIAQAQALIASEIGSRSLIERPMNRTYSIPWSDANPVLVLHDGPLCALTSLSMNTATIDTSNLIVKSWTIQYPGYTFGGNVSVVGTVGYTPQTLPDNLKQALIRMAALINRQPDTEVVSEKIGDYSITRRGANQANADRPSVPVEVRQLLREYLKSPFS